MTSYLVIGISERIAYVRMTYKLVIGIFGRITKNRSGIERF